MICDKCKEQLKIETIYTRGGDEVELTFCTNCCTLQDITMTGYELKLD